MSGRRELSMISRETPPPPYRRIPWFWRIYGLRLVLVLVHVLVRVR